MTYIEFIEVVGPDFPLSRSAALVETGPRVNVRRGGGEKRCESRRRKVEGEKSKEQSRRSKVEGAESREEATDH